MKTIPISERFGDALSLASTKGVRGFQARLSTESEVDPGNISAMKRLGKGASEDIRRRVFSKIIQLIPDFPAKSYEDFLDLGRWILDGRDPEEWNPPARGAVSVQLPALQDSAFVSEEPNVSHGQPVHGKIEATIPEIAAAIGTVDRRAGMRNADGRPMIDPHEYETVAMTLNVTRSKTVYKTALLSNIMAFDQAVKGEEELNDLRKGMEQIMAKLEMIQEQNKVMAERLGMVETEKKRAGNDH